MNKSFYQFLMNEGDNHGKYDPESKDLQPDEDDDGAPYRPQIIKGGAKKALDRLTIAQKSRAEQAKHFGISIDDINDLRDNGFVVFPAKARAVKESLSENEKPSVADQMHSHYQKLVQQERQSVVKQFGPEENNQVWNNLHLKQHTSGLNGFTYEVRFDNQRDHEDMVNGVIEHLQTRGAKIAGVRPHPLFTGKDYPVTTIVYHDHTANDHVVQVGSLYMKGIAPSHTVTFYPKQKTVTESQEERQFYVFHPVRGRRGPFPESKAREIADDLGEDWNLVAHEPAKDKIKKVIKGR